MRKILSTIIYFVCVMNGYDTLIYLLGFSTLLIAKTPIGEASTPDEVAQVNNDNTIIYSCNNLSNKVMVQIEETKTIANIGHDSSNINSRRTIPDAAQARFWWAAEQFDPFEGQLVQDWLTYPKKQQINLIVNWQLWTLLDYLGRYRFVNQFGTVAREYGYSLNIFNQKEQCLATYKYNSVSNPPKWELYLEKLGQDSLQVKPTEFEGIEDEG